VAVRDADRQGFAAAAAAIGPSHVGRSPGLVDKDQAFGIEIELAFEPGLRVASRCRGDPARRRVRSFFAHDGVAGEEAADRPVANLTPWAVSAWQLFDRDVKGWRSAFLRKRMVAVSLH
jgi:hypothetical protein